MHKHLQDMSDGHSGQEAPDGSYRFEQPVSNCSSPSGVIPIGYFLREFLLAEINTPFSLDFEEQNELHKKKSTSHSFSSTCGRNMSPYGWIFLSK